MHFATLASGSSGNAILVGEGNRHFLVDSGISGKSLLHNLSVLNIPASGIEGVVVTHEHVDHIKGVGILARKLKVPVYATKAIWDEMNGVIGRIAPEHRVEIKDSFTCAGLDIKIFPTSHDSRESYGLKIERREPAKKILTLGITTDTGTITEEIHRSMCGCHAFIVEANHDEEMLWQGRYPWHLKKRISSIYGHLANKQLAEALIEWIDENTQRIVLAHLSEENNTPEIALSTVARILRASTIRKKNPEVRLRVAPRYTPHELIVLREE